MQKIQSFILYWRDIRVHFHVVFKVKFKFVLVEILHTLLIVVLNDNNKRVLDKENKKKNKCSELDKSFIPKVN